MSRKNWEAENYYSKDFDWDELREEVENNPSFQFHLLPFTEATQIQDAHRDSEAWDKFHARHSTGKFFKERRYLLKEFPELASCKNDSKVLEVGCGNGSTALPILCGREGIVLYACDCSNEALERAKEIISASNSVSARNRFHPFLCDFSTTGFPEWLAYNPLGFSEGDGGANTDETKSCTGGVDFVTLIFTLSALPLDRMPKAIQECLAVLKPGGMLLFRDYGNSEMRLCGNLVIFMARNYNFMYTIVCNEAGVYDMTMLRFDPTQRIGYREYLRSDGTRSYFFCLDTVRTLTSAAGFTEVEVEYCCVKSVNRRKGKIMRRVWVHGKFQKPFP